MKFDELAGFSVRVSEAAKEIAEVNKSLKTVSKQEEITALMLQQSENLKELSENTSKALTAILNIFASEEIE